MNIIVKKIILSIICISILDVIFLFVMSNTFSKIVSSIQNSPMKIRLIPVIICYILIIIGYNYFITLNNKSVLDSFILGFVIYGIYDMTTMAIFKGWNWKVAIIDMIWGGTIFSLTTLIINSII